MNPRQDAPQQGVPEHAGAAQRRVAWRQEGGGGRGRLLASQAAAGQGRQQEQGQVGAQPDILFKKVF